jgi:hypothetical protein
MDETEPPAFLFRHKCHYRRMAGRLPCGINRGPIQRRPNPLPRLSPWAPNRIDSSTSPPNGYPLPAARTLGKSVSEQARSQGEVDAWAVAIADMLCAYVERETVR